jgi:uncharacterized protein (TIGR02118 family)
LSIKLIVLYPPPVDEAAFERAYHTQHMPFMRSVISPSERVPTFRVTRSSGTPIYRVAQIDFENIAELEAFGRSEAGKRARRSSESVSTGGAPLVLICEKDPVS